MPDKRIHRGPHPADEKLFAREAIGDLQTALADFSLLLTKGYAGKSSLKLVGDRFSLTQRQRLAIMRSACSDGQLASRSRRCLRLKDIASELKISEKEHKAPTKTSPFFSSILPSSFNPDISIRSKSALFIFLICTVIFCIN